MNEACIVVCIGNSIVSFDSNIAVSQAIVHIIDLTTNHTGNMVIP